MVTKLDKIIHGRGEVKGFTFTQVFENDNGYIYEVKSNISTRYEAFLKKQSVICIDFAKKIYSDTEFKERYPKARDFGTWAWATSSLDKAKKYLE